MFIEILEKLSRRYCTGVYLQNTIPIGREVPYFIILYSYHVYKWHGRSNCYFIMPYGANARGGLTCFFFLISKVTFILYWVTTDSKNTRKLLFIQRFVVRISKEILLSIEHVLVTVLAYDGLRCELFLHGIWFIK